LYLCMISSHRCSLINTVLMIPSNNISNRNEEMVPPSKEISRLG
jgi:hypothetical protein